MSSKYFVCCRLCISGLWRNQRMMIFPWNCKHLYMVHKFSVKISNLIDISLPYAFFIFHSSRSKVHTYNDVVERVAHQLGLDDPAKIRLTSHICYSQQPKPQPIKYRGVEHLLDMLIHYNQVNVFRFFWSCSWFLCSKFVLEFLLKHYLFGTDIWHLVLWSAGYSTSRIAVPENPESCISPSYKGWGLFSLPGTYLVLPKYFVYIFEWYLFSQVVIYSIRLPKNSTIADVINDLKTKVSNSFSLLPVLILLSSLMFWTVRPRFLFRVCCST